ncbi:DNA-binding protein [Rhizobium rhizosphaerae]|uniref:DNA-binding protein n=1 Tax=Xaviernesmea rhizosphaerae TaxID=1672749 RepID=A0A1Q9APM3_9HYPH|nr:YafY family protein [Xaviernesmea rhizosphaerae]OLP57377.1 DNA-binding protein [Xaviernesmea rhizosphaerae]
MSRASRLITLIEILRRHRFPVSAAALAAETGVSVRTLYRDIDTLRGQGADIAGEAGLGYVLRPGFTLPPLMFGEDEIEAVALGLRWVTARGDGDLARAAEQALAKIEAVLPAPLAERLQQQNLLVGPARQEAERIDTASLRAAIRAEIKLDLAYRDGAGAVSQRIVWPFALGFFETTRILIAWCELRGAIRHFRTDRIDNLLRLDQRYPKRRAQLLAEWRRQQLERRPVRLQSLNAPDRN